jgi:hypothetical protein
LSKDEPSIDTNDETKMIILRDRYAWLDHAKDMLLVKVDSFIILESKHLSEALSYFPPPHYLKPYCKLVKMLVLGKRLY